MAGPRGLEKLQAMEPRELGSIFVVCLWATACVVTWAGFGTGTSKHANHVATMIVWSLSALGTRARPTFERNANIHLRTRGHAHDARVRLCHTVAAHVCVIWPFTDACVPMKGSWLACGSMVMLLFFIPIFQPRVDINQGADEGVYVLFLCARLLCSCPCRLGLGVGHACAPACAQVCMRVRRTHACTQAQARTKWNHTRARACMRVKATGGEDYCC